MQRTKKKKLIYCSLAYWGKRIFKNICQHIQVCVNLPKMKALLVFEFWEGKKFA